ncbi:RluA family pseudouridine synthase [Kaistia geumhonensis]|uniref:Pseudouridine synthase n=1 Tax=Kaistia geumhonensis TaxID=410839 RepID=A0ABU0MB47_9HYPH|nr:RluA family pseudouridine synthase [Kaistia geumhonensis]MCX5480968.1 RluA family pseudouridine synthase [Kaistia geumhonensis]MDQ0518025.1 23S rRNA pseudouridine1911/1915/1917 synthase [Kaistia geumhonensis]
MNDLQDDGQDDGEEIVDLVVEPEAAGRRLDAWLASRIDTLSRSRIKALIESGHVAIGGATIVEAKKPVNSGDVVQLSVPEAEPAEPEGEDIPLDIVFEDEALIVIDKPAGLVVHPGAGNWTGTLVNALIAHCGDSLSGIGGVKRPGIVHRLDKGTSGLIVVAKTDRAHQGLAAQFADHGRTGPLERGYLALVWGVPSLPYGLVDAPLGRSPTNRQRMAIVKQGGKEAITHYTVEESYGPASAPIASLVDLRLETGRTHQIRVHMAALGHPLIGDPDYGKGFQTKVHRLPEPLGDEVGGFQRQALHAWLLGFEHPLTGETLRFESEPPEDLAELIEGFKAL